MKIFIRSSGPFSGAGGPEGGSGRGVMENEALLDRLIDRYHISMEANRVEANPVSTRKMDFDDIEHYRCRLAMPGKQMNFYVTIEAGEGLLSPSDVLLMLVLDASGCEMLKGYYGKHEEFEFAFAGSDGNIEEFDEFWREYKGRCTQIQKLRAFLGEPLYSELVSRLGFK